MGNDSYLIPGTSVLRNRLGISDAEALDEVMNDYASVAWASLHMTSPVIPNLEFFRHIHVEMFSRVFSWAGEYRTVSVSPAGVNRDYCPPDEIEARLEFLFTRLVEADFLQNLEPWEFCSKAADVWSELTYLHPYRDGNTRSQSLWVTQLVEHAGYELDWTKINPVHLRDVRLSS